MKKCDYCERVFDESDAIFDDGVCCCPYCESQDVYDAVRCECCGQYEFDDDVLYGVCKECRESLVFNYRYNAQKCFDLSQNQKETVSLNAFILSQFSAEEIENILLQELKWNSQIPYSDYINFIKEDEAWFFEEAIKEAKGGESDE